MQCAYVHEIRNSENIDIQSALIVLVQAVIFV
jgi:hypothetical protein